MKSDDKQLIKRILTGETKAYREFVDNYKRLVAHVVFRMVRNPSDREDLCQDVFVKAYQNMQNFKFQSKVSTWLARIAYNTCINHLEKKRIPLLHDTTPEDMTFEDFASSGIDPYQETENESSKVFIHHLIFKLPVLYRTVLTLYHLDGMSYAEITEVMTMPEGTVKSYLFRARSMLKESLKNQKDVVL